MSLTPAKNCNLTELQEDRNYLCEICGVKRGTEKHHAIFRRDVRHKDLDCAINYQLVCQRCHAMYADSRQNRALHIERQQARYGMDVYNDWLDNLKMKVKRI